MTATLYLASYGLSLLGAGMASVLMPLLVLDRTGDVLAAGVLATVATGTAALVGILGGVVVDHLDRRVVSAASSAAAAFSVAALPLVDSVWGLSLPWFLTFAALGAVLRVPGTTAHEALLPAMARLQGRRAAAGRRPALDRLLGIRETLATVLLLVGPGLGGLAVALFGITPKLLLLTAATSLAGAGLTLLIDSRAGRVSPPRRLADDERGPVVRAAAEIATGWRFLGRQRAVLGATLVSASFIAIISALQSTLMPAYFTSEGLPALTGLTLSAFAAGSLVGSTLFVTVSSVRRRTWFVVGMLGSLVGFAALGTLASPWVVLGAAALVGLTNAPAGAVLGILTIEATPDVARGRVLGTQNAILLGAPALTGAPLGALAAGAGLPVAAAALAALAAVTAVVALCARVFRDLGPPDDAVPSRHPIEAA